VIFSDGKLLKRGGEVRTLIDSSNVFDMFYKALEDFRRFRKPFKLLVLIGSLLDNGDLGYEVLANAVIRSCEVECFKEWIEVLTLLKDYVDIVKLTEYLLKQDRGVLSSQVYEELLKTLSCEDLVTLANTPLDKGREFIKAYVKVGLTVASCSDIVKTKALGLLSEALLNDVLKASDLKEALRNVNIKIVLKRRFGEVSGIDIYINNEKINVTEDVNVIGMLKAYMLQEINSSVSSLAS